MIKYTLFEVSKYHRIAYAKVDYNKESELYKFLENEKVNLKQLTSFSNSNRKIEWMTIRYLLLKVHQVDDTIVYDTHGKPHFTVSNSHLSISHSHDMVAVSINENKTTGIDIQLISDKIDRIKHKFLAESELKQLENNPLNLTIYWSCKEALFKVYGKKDAYLKDNMRVSNLELNQTTATAEGAILINDTQTDHQLKVILLEDYVLAYVVNS